MAMSSEVVNFGWSGLKELKAEVKSTGKEVDNMRKTNAKLTRDLSSGAFEKHAKRLATVRREMVGVRVEQERMQRMAAKQSLIGAYGRVGGTAAYYGSRFSQSRLGGMAGGIGGSVASGLGVLGVGLGYGSLASRGFAGTAAAARADAALDRLGRHVASDLAPALERLTNIINGFSDSRNKVNAGTGSTTDRIKSAAMSPWAIGGGVAAAGYLRLAGFGGALADARAAGGAARFAGGAIGRAGPFGAMIAAGGYGIYHASELGDQQDRLNALKTVTTHRGRATTFDTNMTAAEAASSKDLVSGFSSRSPGDRAKYIEEERKKNREAIANIEGKSILGGVFGSIFGDDDKKRNDLYLRKNALDRLENERKGGAKFSQGQGVNENFGMLQVQGAGQRRSSTDLYEELASTVPVQLLSEKKGEEKKADGASNEKVANLIADLISTVNPAMAAIVRLFG